MSSPILWLITQDTPFWEELESSRTVLRLPIVQDRPTVTLIRTQMKINQIFLGLDSNRRRVYCVGSLLTGAFPIQGGWTIELLPRHVMSNEFLFREPFQLPKHLPAELTYYRRKGSILPVGVDILQELFINERGYWELYEAVIELMQDQRSEQQMEEIEVIFSERKCTDEESDEVLAILRSLIRHIGGQPESTDELKSAIGRVMVLLHAEELAPEDWNTLWERLITNWRQHLGSLAHR